MNVQQVYSHYNGQEFLAIHDPSALPDIVRHLSGVPDIVDDSTDSEDALDKALAARLTAEGWASVIPNHYTRRRYGLSLPGAMLGGDTAGLGIHSARYQADATDVGFHICWCLESDSDSGSTPYQRIVAVLRQRDATVPAVPLVVIGVRR